jgi:hypothetical protein
MKIMVVLLSVAAVLVAVSIPVPAGAMSPVGTFKYVRSHQTVKGRCPLGVGGPGTLSIARAKKGYVLRYLTGTTCRPASVCVLYGNCRAGNCVFSTTVTVDNEGGKVTNTAALRFAAGGATGAGHTVYRHPSGFTCTWTFQMRLKK